MIKIIKICIFMILFSSIVVAEMPSDENIFDQFLLDTSSTNSKKEASNTLKAVVKIDGKVTCVLGDKIIDNCEEDFE